MVKYLTEKDLSTLCKSPNVELQKMYSAGKKCLDFDIFDRRMCTFVYTSVNQSILELTTPVEILSKFKISSDILTPSYVPTRDDYKLLKFGQHHLSMPLTFSEDSIDEDSISENAHYSIRYEHHHGASSGKITPRVVELSFTASTFRNISLKHKNSLRKIAKIMSSDNEMTKIFHTSTDDICIIKLSNCCAMIHSHADNLTCTGEQVDLHIIEAPSLTLLWQKMSENYKKCILTIGC